MSAYPYRIPDKTLQSLRAYIAGQHPYPFGSFVTAVLANDLVGAIGQADEENRMIILDYAMFLYNEMPWRTGNPERDFWGSYEAVANQVAKQRAAHEAKKANKEQPSDA